MHITNLYPYQNSVISSLKVDELEVSHADINELHTKYLDVNTAKVANITTSHLVATTADIDEVSINLLNILDTTLAEELNVDGDIKASGSVKLKTDPADQGDTPYLTIGPNFNQPYTFSVSKDGTIQAKDVYMEAITVGDTIPNMTVQSDGLTTINTGTSAGKAISVTRGTSPTTEAVAISGDGSIILTPTGTGNAISVGNVATISKAGAISGSSITTSGAVSSNTLAVGSNMTVDDVGNINSATITTTGTATVNALSVNGVASISSTGAITTSGEVSSNTLTVGGGIPNMEVNADGKININAGTGIGSEAVFSIYNGVVPAATINRDGTFAGTKAIINGNGAGPTDTILTVGSSTFTKDGAATINSLDVGSSAFTVSDSGLTTINSTDATALSINGVASISSAGDITTDGEVSSNTLTVGGVMTVDDAGNITTTGTATVNALSVDGVASISSSGDISGTSLTTSGEVSSNTLTVGGVTTVDNAGNISSATITTTGTATVNALSVENGGGEVASISSSGDISGTSITTSGAASVDSLTVGGVTTVDNAGNITTIGTATVNALSVENSGSEVASISSSGDISGKSLTLTDPSLSVGRTLKLGTGGLVTSSLFAGTAVCNYTEDKPITVSTFGSPLTGTLNVTSVGVTGDVTNGFEEVFNDNSLCVLDTNSGPDGTSFVLSPGYHRFSVTTNFSVVSDTATHSRMFSIVVGAIPTDLPANTSIWYGLDSFTSFTDTDTETVNVRRGMFVSKTFTFVVTCSTERRMRLGVMFGAKNSSFNPPDSIKFSHRAIGPTRPEPNTVKALWDIVDAGNSPIANPTVVQIDSWAINSLADSEYRMVYPA